MISSGVYYPEWFVCSFFLAVCCFTHASRLNQAFEDVVVAQSGALWENLQFLNKHLQIRPRADSFKPLTDVNMDVTDRKFEIIVDVQLQVEGRR